MAAMLRDMTFDEVMNFARMSVHESMDLVKPRQQRDRIMARPLPQTAPDDHPPPLPPLCIRQNITFQSLPAEIRNRIYELALPSKNNGDPPLVVASPTWDNLMVSAVEPGITRACRQTRSESLKMFYEANDFHVYIERLDFRPLIAFVKSKSNMISTKLRIHVYMLDRVTCYSGLTPFALAWNTVKRFELFHLEIHSAFDGPGKRQCSAVASAVGIAEQKRTKRAMQSRLEVIDFTSRVTCLVKKGIAREGHTYNQHQILSTYTNATTTNDSTNNVVRILILGATGYIGLATSLALRRNSHIVYGLARTPAKAQDLAKNEIIPIIGTVEDGAYLKAIDEHNIDVVIDTAAVYDASWKVLEGVKKAGEERLKKRGKGSPKLGFVYTPGTWVHGTSSARLNDLNPADRFGVDTASPAPPPDLVAWRPKLENAVLEARDVLDVVVLRPACLYGRGSFIWSAWFGELLKAAEGKKETVVLECDANSTLSLVHVDEVASALTVTAEKISALGSVYPVFDIVSSRESARLILQGGAKSMGFEGTVEFVKPKDPFAVAMSTSARLDSPRARDLLGWESKRMFGMLDEVEIITAAWLASRT
ncbi:hypothetical protein PRZ48_009481 [Zasmidium cellare]|uniref:NAD-dependent epimerase/dehydratase domain-containing protein n=1 Tax=Zasmidium cellare TaxID=395010 RepID=A0ABR0ECH0_ZASCE|nr:hypothetical protein PRZ48_009481 [Zasmidium cellare]